MRLPHTTSRCYLWTKWHPSSMCNGWKGWHLHTGSCLFLAQMILLSESVLLLSVPGAFLILFRSSQHPNWNATGTTSSASLWSRLAWGRKEIQEAWSSVLNPAHLGDGTIWQEDMALGNGLPGRWVHCSDQRSVPMRMGEVQIVVVKSYMTYGLGKLEIQRKSEE